MKKNNNLSTIIISIVITSIISAITVGTITYTRFIMEGKTDYYKIIKDKNVQDFLGIYSEITNNYFDEINKEELINHAISGMTDYLDDKYTTSLDENDSSQLIGKLNSTYEGVGITIKNNKIVNIVPGSSADQNGLLENDVIVNINGIEIEDDNPETITNIIQNSEKTVTITILRNEERKTFELTISKLSVPNVYYEIIDNIAYINIDVFANEVSNEMIHALNKVEFDGMKGLIIDLRNNTGGYLEEVDKISKMFLTKDTIIYGLKDRKKINYIHDNTEEHKEYPIIVLVNGATASAAEILASTLKDSYGALIIGTKTYGKGKVQHTYTLKNGNIVKYTSYIWLRKNGKSIDEKGIIPDYEIENTYIYADDGSENIIGIKDNQREKALEILNQ